MKVIRTLVFTILFAAVTSAGRIPVKNEDEIRGEPDTIALNSILHKLPHNRDDLLLEMGTHKVKGTFPEIRPHQERGPLLEVGHPQKHRLEKLKEHRKPAPHQEPPKDPENEEALATTTESVPEGSSTNGTTAVSNTTESESENEVVTSAELESTTESEDDKSTDSISSSTSEPNSDDTTEASGDSESTTTPGSEEEEGESTEINVTTTVETGLESESESSEDSVVSTTESETTEVPTTIVSANSESVEASADNETKSWWQRMFSWI